MLQKYWALRLNIYSNVMNKILGTKIKEKMLVDKTDISGFIGYSHLNKQNYQPKEN